MPGEQTGPRPPVDFGKAAADYGKWRQGFPPAFFARLDAFGLGRDGQRVLDLGTGTGLLARDFARRGCSVTGLDLSPELLAEARKTDVAEGLAIDYIQAPAEATGLPDAAFDLVSAGTCWHWFDARAAAAEARRVLRPAGRLLICSLDWCYGPGNVIDATVRTIRKYSTTRPGASSNVFEFPKGTEPLADAGFDAWESFAFTIPLTYSREAWRGRIRASAGVGPIMDAETLARFDAEMAAVLDREFPPGDLSVDHRAFGLIAWTRPA